MENFRFKASTDIFFGKGEIIHLPEVLKELGHNVLLTYGGGSIKKNGVYDQVIDLLNKNRFKVTELSGIEPNPRLETVKKGAALCHEHHIDVILAVGGGSTLDCSKAIGAAYYYDGDPWDFTKDRSLVKAVLPIVTVLTMAATGSEMNRNAVITNPETNEKLGTSGWNMIPYASFLDPTYTYSVSEYQTAAGSADILSHLFENYFSKTLGADVQDRTAEGLMKTVIQYCPVALKEPDNYDARANLMWASSLALNGLTGGGKSGSWSCHPIEHELSAFYDITHGIGLAILTPRWMNYILNETTVNKFAAYAANVWSIPADEDKFKTARAGIQATYNYFKSCGIPMTLPEVGIDESHLAKMAERAVYHSSIATSAYVPIDAGDVENILKDCMTENRFV